MEQAKKKMTHKKLLTGTVVSEKMAKTVVVKVDDEKVHPIYKKRYVVSKRYKAHDPNKDYHVGDVVTIEETRPMSAQKRWRVVKKIEVKKQ
ncbi:MAG: hypothetical protein ACD_76C00094G0017 [uncultured bacterium]|nr:MAG: hypothetical protein ACD_76C00094G0017 [uncultured bacterium]HBD05272.1 30S ribosomal protein S17 [Candidatus Uhrbacteria bacterium]